MNGSTFKKFSYKFTRNLRRNLSFYCDNKTFFFENDELNMLTYNISNTLPVFGRKIRIEINHTRESKGAVNVRCIIDTV